MQIVSTFYKNEIYYMSDILFWYRKLWNTDKFIFFVGNDNLTEFNYNFNGKDFFIREEEDVIFYEYVSGVNDANQWGDLKHFFFREIIRGRHDDPNTIWIDCDEFIYSKDVDKIIKNKKFKTHFYEYVPKTPFKLDGESLWSKCPWYYREQSLGNNILTHDNCKEWEVSVNTCGGGHMGRNSYCKDNYNFDDYDNICFHVGVHSKEHFLTGKHWMQTYVEENICKEINDNDRKSNKLVDIFNEYYFKCEFETFELNLYNKFFENN